MFRKKGVNYLHQLFHSVSPVQVNGIRDVVMPVSVLLPHEVLHALATARGANLIFQSIMMGNRYPKDVAAFWKHVRTLDPWSKHPDLQDSSQDFGKLVGLQFHGDGAEIYRDDEFFCYSFSSIFAGGLVNDVMLYRFPVLLVAERHMQQDSVPGQKNAIE